MEKVRFKKEKHGGPLPHNENHKSIPVNSMGYGKLRWKWMKSQETDIHVSRIKKLYMKGVASQITLDI